MKPGDVFIKSLKTHDIHRRVIGIHQGIVVYSRGSDKNSMCKVASFEKWLRNKKVRLASDQEAQKNDHGR